MQTTPLDTNRVLDLIAQGNPFVWVALGIVITILFVWGWIRFEPSLRSLGNVIMTHCVRSYKNKKKEEFLMKRNAKERADMFFNRISLLISKISDLDISPDYGRNHFYQYMVTTMFQIFLNDFLDAYNDLENGKMKEADFVLFHKTHKRRIENVRARFRSTVTERLKAEGWSNDKISYVHELFRIWSMTHIELLSELLIADRTASEIIKSWWVFFYETFVDVEKFGIMINGRISGLTFDGYEIKNSYREE